ncbi:MAG TPA: hydrogenase 4 subunit B [bacterium]|jgi:hydrogenase-4 component B
MIDLFDNLTSEAGFSAIFVLFAAGALGSLLLKGRDHAANLWGHWLAIVGSALGVAVSGAALIGGRTPVFNAESSFPLLSLSIRLDSLSGFFMLVISAVALLCSIYALGYARHYYGKYNIGVLGFFYNSFIASMLLVVTARNGLWFLIVWEVMSLASYFLVIYEHREKASIKAGTLYFVMTHLGTAFIVVSFLMMFSVAGSFDFDSIKAALPGASPTLLSAVFLTALIGFGTKAGIIPLHIWLPSAHPAAPSHVSALMSGVMIKTGIYMLIRIGLELLPHPMLWWGTVVLIIGAVSSLLGVLYALAEHDLKRLLAYHSIENIGIILLGLGSSLVFSALGHSALAVLGLMAALYHTMNHATFKALLFLGSGAVISETHTRNIEEYGGLIRHMPQTALFFLVGSMAISALPPFNGFFSEWLTFQTLFNGVTAFDVLKGFPFILAIGSLAFTGGLAAACFVKVFGTTFLARPRSTEAQHAKEAGLSLRIGMAGFAIATLLLGAGAGMVSRGLASIAGTLVGVMPMAEFSPAAVVLPQGFASVSMPAVLLLLILAMAAAGAWVAVLAGKRKVVIGPTWNCGGELTPRMEITATSFSRSIITVFKGVLRPTKQTDIEYHDDRLRYFPKTETVTLKLRDIYQPYLYQPLRQLTDRIAAQTRRIQSGNINAYILYIFLALIGLLLVHVL